MKFSLNLKKIGLIAVEIAAVILLFVAVVSGFFAWKLLQGPMDVEFARPYIETALQDDDAGYAVRMDRIVLQWPDVNGPILLGLQNGRLIAQDDNRVIASIDEAGIALSKGNLLFGRIVPIGLILRNPTLRVVRHEDNSINVGLADAKAKQAEESVAGDAQGNPLQTIIDILLEPESAEGVSSNLSLLSSLQIENAQVSVDDKVIDMTWVLPKLSASLERQQGGVHLGVDVEFARMKERVPALKVSAFVNRETRIAHVETMLEYFEPNFLAQRIPALSDLEGVHGRIDAQLKMDITAEQEILNADLTALAERGSFRIPALSDKPVPYKNLGVMAQYESSSGVLAIKKIQATLNEVQMDATANLTFSDEGFDGPVSLKLSDFPQSAIEPLWPPSLREEPAYEWMVEKLADGSFSDVYAKLDAEGLKSERGWSYDASGVEFGFHFDEMTIQYKSTLGPIKDAKGTGVFKLDEEIMDIEISEAMLLDMPITKASAHLENFMEKGQGLATIQIMLDANVPSVLTYIKDEPIGIQTEIDVANAKGTGPLEINLNIPTKSDVTVEEIKIGVKGTVNEAVLPNVYKGMPLTGGPFELLVKDNLFTAKGSGQLSGRDATVEYSEFLDSEGQEFNYKVKAKLSVDEEMRQNIGMDLSSFMRGPANVDVTYTEFSNDTAEAEVAADFGPSTLFIEPMDYEKLPGAPGTATLKAYLTNGEIVEIKDLSGTGPNLRLGSTTLKFRQDSGETELDSGVVSQFTVGETVASLTFSYDQADAVTLDVKGPYLDARPFLNGDETKAEDDQKQAMNLSVEVDRMRTSEEDQVQYAKFKANIDDQGRYDYLELDGSIGKGTVRARYGVNAQGIRAFNFETDDAGATLKAFGVYENVIGGRLIISGAAAQAGDRNITGLAEMTDFRVVRAPALAKLLSIMSLPGVGQLLNNEGLVFSKLESGFEWVYQPQGSLMVVKDGRTSGNSLGLTFDGTIDISSRTIDIKGTVIPLSGINALIGNIPLVGDILTGGTGSLIAATYTMRGSGENVDTSVNPLSVLTPGILRRVLFE